MKRSSLAITPFRLAPARCFGSAQAQAQAQPPPTSDILPKLQHLGFSPSALQCLSDPPAPALAAQWRKIHLLLRDQVPVSLLSKPHVLRFLSATPDEKIVSFLDVFQSFDVSFEHSVKLLLRNPALASLRTDSLRRKWAFFEELRLDKQMMGTRLHACPWLFSMSTETLRQRYADLQAMGLNTRDLSKIISKWPSILCGNASESIRRLHKEGIGIESVLKMLLMDARVLRLPAERLLKKFAIFEELGLEKNSWEFCRAMSVLSTSKTELVQARFHWLMTRGFSFKEVVQLLSKCPGIFRMTDRLLAKKIDYLVEVLDRDISEIPKFPAYLSYSLEKRIIPRFSVLDELQREGKLKGKLSTSAVLARSDENFKKYTARMNKSSRGKRNVLLPSTCTS